MSLPDSTSIAGIAVGTSATTSPLWWDMISAAYQPLAALLGLIVLVLTIAKLWKENRRLDRDNKRGGN